MTYSNFAQKSWNTFVTSFLLSILSLFSHFRYSFCLFDRWLCFQLRLGPYFFASYKALCTLYITHDTGKEDLFGNQQLLELEAISFILMTVILN